MTRGKRESSWLVIRRCLAIIRRAQRGPASREELLQAMEAVERTDHPNPDGGMRWADDVAYT